MLRVTEFKAAQYSVFSIFAKNLKVTSNQMDEHTNFAIAATRTELIQKVNFTTPHRKQNRDVNLSKTMRTNT